MPRSAFPVTVALVDPQLLLCPQKAGLLGLTDVVRAAIQHHRDVWITEADFVMMATAGINAVRLPIGYWVLANTQV